MLKVRQSQSGFSAVEMLITLVVGAAAFAAFVGLFISIQGIMRRSRDVTKASDIAQTVIQEYENQPFAALDCTLSNEPITGGAAAAVSELRQPATATVTLTEIDTNTDDCEQAEIKKVVVTVTFGPDHREISYGSIINPSVGGTDGS